MDVFEGVEVHLAGLAFQVDHLAAHQAGGAGGQGQLAYHLEQPLGGHTRAAQGHHLEGARQQGITGQNRLGLAVHLVVGGPATAQVVVVHGGQVVMDERHGVDHLHRHRRGHGQIGVAAGQLTGRQGQDRSQPLATGQERVAHRLPQRLRTLGAEGAVQGGLHAPAGRLQVGGEVERRAHRRGHGVLRVGADSLRPMVAGAGSAQQFGIGCDA